MTFQNAGVYNGVFIIEDDQTHCLWSHVEGICLQGKYVGTRLKYLPSTETRWGKWKQLHPNTLVTLGDPKYKDKYYTRSADDRDMPLGFEKTFTHKDDRLDRFTLVLGVLSNDAARAYVMKALDSKRGVVNDTLGGVPLAVFYDSRTRTGVAFERTTDKGRVLEFERAPGTAWLARDTDTGSLWDLSGKCVKGSYKGRELKAARYMIAKWYGWSSYFPKTDYYPPVLTSSDPKVSK